MFLLAFAASFKLFVTNNILKKVAKFKYFAVTLTCSGQVQQHVQVPAESR